MNKIEEALHKLFCGHRIIFWYDAKEELISQFEELLLDGVEKVKVGNNPFYIKWLVTKDSPDKKFLLYFNTEEPTHADNWLLDIQTANYVFNTDQASLFMQELGIEYHLKDFINEHIEFFRNKERRAKLKEYLTKGDTSNEIAQKMLAVMFRTDEVSIDACILHHASAYLNSNTKFDDDLKRFNLYKFYWDEIKDRFNYDADEPSIYDFLIEVFSSNFSLGNSSGVRSESKIFLSNWKDRVSYQELFRSISEKISNDIKVEELLNSSGIDTIVEDDLFRLIDMRIISELASRSAEEDISVENLNQIIKKRENKFWHYEFENFYACLKYGREMISLVRNNDSFKTDDFHKTVDAYASELYSIDYLYRKFIWSYRETNQNRVLQLLYDKVEKVYVNDWLYQFNNKWQSVIDDMDVWDNTPRVSQKRFFNDHVKPVIKKGQRLFVVISDALRYECGLEYFKMIQKEKRFEGEMNYMISSLPTYTQLGMASLLPHNQLSFKDGSDNILADGMSTQGVQSRSKVLEKNAGVTATAVNAEEFMALNSSTEGREFVKQYNLIYIYHNHIDKTGDDKISQDKVFGAVKDEIEYLIDVVKKIASMNGNSMFITSDHGFLFQSKDLDSSDFIIDAINGEKWKDTRRYVIGKKLKSNGSVKHFTAKQLNLSGDAEVVIPKSINRIRLQGSGSKFVHGGATLQEIVIPLIKVSKTRQDTTRQVEIDIIKHSDQITTNTLIVSFLQTELVTEKVLPRKIRVAIYADDSERLSNQQNYTFDVTEGIERQREVKLRFNLSAIASSKYKNQRVKLKLEEPVEGTNKWKEYKSFYYTLNISFTNDFD